MKSKHLIVFFRLFLKSNRSINWLISISYKCFIFSTIRKKKNELLFFLCSKSYWAPLGGAGENIAGHRQTSNTAEIAAITCACLMAKRHRRYNVVIRTNAKYIIQCELPEFIKGVERVRNYTYSIFGVIL